MVSRDMIKNKKELQPLVEKQEITRNIQQHNNMKTPTRDKTLNNMRRGQNIQKMAKVKANTLEPLEK